MPVNQLDDFLGKFYAEVRKEDGSLYSKNGFLGIRYGLQKHFLSKGFDIVKDKIAFSNSNAMFAAVLVKLKLEGLGCVEHKQPLSKEYFRKLYSSQQLNIATPTGLQNKVFVDIMIYLCNRDRENLRKMNASDFHIMSNSEGHRYVSMSDKLTKNHRGATVDERSQKGRMYETGLDRCPVSSFEKYVAKLHPDCNSFWQKPNENMKSEESRWFCNVPLGKNTLGEKMKKLSVAAGLSYVYTNHCLRATTITTLDHSGCEARHMMAISGQKSEASIRSYSTHVADSTMRAMSLALTSHMAGDGIVEQTVSQKSLTLHVSEDAENVPPRTNLSNTSIASAVEAGQKKYEFHFHNCSVSIVNQ